jgi:ubiquinone/menaquinone biosynthesis C-methylase UbiE
MQSAGELKTGKERPAEASAEREPLFAALRELEQKTDAEWLSSLNPRKKAELAFHDRQRGLVNTLTEQAYEDVYTNEKYYSTVMLSKNYVDSWIEMHAPGKVFLDYACGNGECARIAARSGAEVAIGLDISRVSIENCRQAARLKGLANAVFIQGDCESTGLPANSIDVVLCSGMLHHLDLSYGFCELRRIMKPGGVALAIEALDYNPLIKLYRRLTPHLRTEWEKAHILSLKDIDFARRFFEVRNVRYWHFLSILTTPLRRTPIFASALKLANGLDSILLRLFPIRLLAWMFSFELVKRPDEARGS